MPDSNIGLFRLQCVCSPCAEAALNVLSHRSLQLICGCLPQTQHLSIILISNIYPRFHRQGLSLVLD